MSEERIHTEESVKSLNHLSRIAKVFVSPTEAFEDIKENPKVLIPMILIVLVATVVAFLGMGNAIQLQQETMINAYKMNGLEIPADGFQSMAKAAAYLSVGIAGVSVIIAVLIRSLLTHGVSSFFGSEGSFKKVFSATLYAYMIVLAGTLLQTLLGILSGVSTLTLSPAMFMDISQMTSPLYVILSALNLFTIWYLVVVTIAVKVIENLSTAKAAFCALLPYLLMIGFSLVTTMLASSAL